MDNFSHGMIFQVEGIGSGTDFFISDLFVICQHTNANDIAGKSALRQEGRKAKKR